MNDLLPAINQSQLKSWRRCQREWDYHYRQRLVSRRKSRALFLGSWVHAALETYYRDGDWKIGHNQYLAEYNALFEEEQLLLDGRKGHLPDVVPRIMRSYLWYRRNDNWKVIATEQVFDVVLKGVRFKGRIDLIIEDETGLWVIDHKTASTIPMATAFHAMNPQLIIYPWAAKKMWGMDVTGVMYNYVKSKAPSIPTMTRAGNISKRRIVTDYPTALRFLKANGFDPADFTDYLAPLRKKSEFLRRYKLPLEPGVLRQILQEALWTGREIYNHKNIVRNITPDCVRCAYQALCRAELNGLDTTHMLKYDYEIEEESYLDDHGESDTAESEDAEE